MAEQFSYIVNLDARQTVSGPALLPLTTTTTAAAKPS
jgi:hypothetical protein